MEKLVGVGRGFRRYWSPLALVTVLLLAGVLGAAPSYGEAQTATDAEAFQRIVSEQEVGEYRLAALIDILFAAGYGLLALIALSRLKESSGRGLRAARLGCWLVFAGAILDQLENVMVLVNVANRNGVGDLAIGVMTTLGKLKWTAVLVGLLLLLGGLVFRGLWPLTTKADVVKWTRKVWKPYSIYLGLVLLLVVLVLTHQRWLAVLSLLALVIVGIWINRVVHASREEERTGTDLGPARLALAFAQLAIGVALFVWGIGEQAGPAMTDIPGSGAGIVVRDIFAVFGLALAIMSLGSFISELRQNTRFQNQRSRVLFIAAVVLLAAGALVGAGILLLVLFGVAVLLGEVATELSAADRRRGNPADGSRRNRWIALIVVEVLGLVALVGMGADPVHAIWIAAALSIFVLMALLDGDALFVVALVGLLVVAVTRPYEVELEETLLPAAGEPYILVIGDSYISGEGAQEYLPGTNEVVSGPATETSVNECRQAPTAWGFEVARLAAAGAIGDEDNPFPTRVLFLGCSGAVSENIDIEPRRGSDGTIHGPAQLLLYKQFVERTEFPPPSLVIVGIGGNDGGFGDLGQACVGPGNCAEVAQQFLENRPERLIEPPVEGQSEALADIDDDLDRAFAKIRTVVGQGMPIVATSYPEPVATSEKRCASALLGAEERVFINGFAMQLNEQVRAAAARAEISFMDISDALAEGGSQLCDDSPTPGLNFLAFGSKGGRLRDSLDPTNWAHNSLHPSTEGHRLFAEDAYDWFDDHWPLQAPVIDAVGAPTVAQFLDTLGVEQCRPQDDRLCSVEHGTWLTEQATAFYRTAILPVGALVFALYLVLLPLVARPSAASAQRSADGP